MGDQGEFEIVLFFLIIAAFVALYEYFRETVSADRQ